MNNTMERKKVFEKPFVEITFDEESKVIIARWIGFLKLDDLKTGCAELTSFIKKNNIKNHLSDHTRLKILSKEVQGYLGGTWFPEVSALGLQKVAVLVSNDVFAQATVDNVNKTTIGKLQMNTYPSEKQCLDWLNS